MDHFKKIKYDDGITYGELFLENDQCGGTPSRPIRWILALHGDNIVPFVFAGVIRIRAKRSELFEGAMSVRYPWSISIQ
ncbi:Glycine--tRNA ligase protein [Dioscorea alata]|uniref:Glycine--tRNA ligase protein n=1 Tax=Dioscorea alata TaxID=55571 RepID=A0ACB7V9R8_DIOAL|nr:Glycine--tRNA ligase protein [Dioscorea alata]